MDGSKSEKKLNTFPNAERGLLLLSKNSGLPTFLVHSGTEEDFELELRWTRAQKSC